MYKIKKGTALTNEQHGWGLFCFPCSNLIISSLVVWLAIMCIFSASLWYRNLQVSSVQFTGVFIGLFIDYSFPQTFTVCQNFAIYLLAVFLLSFYWLAANYILTYCTEIQQIFS